METEEIARKLWAKYGQNRTSAVIFALEGPLGAGKTTFAKALAEAMGITDTIISPTFVLHREYPQLDHIDAWRIEDPQELVNLGLSKMVLDKKVIVIEWAGRVKSQITNFKSQVQIIWIKFDYTQNEGERTLTFSEIR